MGNEFEFKMNNINYFEFQNYQVLLDILLIKFDKTRKF